MPLPHFTDKHLSAGFNFDNSYASLPEILYTCISPVPVCSPQIFLWNNALANNLGLDGSALSDGQKAAFGSGNILPEGAKPLAQAYAGHQFGGFSYLGDGRAHLLGEHIAPDGTRVDIQLKGSGCTPYSRNGDGRAALAPMLREYLISEAMHALEIPSTRSLAVVTTGERVQRQYAEDGAILTRIAASHIRVGTFEYLAACGDENALQALADYTIFRHYPEITGKEQPYIELLDAVMRAYANLVAHWLGIGFIHGVMNTDNVAVSGETIDYGPCAFMNTYDPATVFSSIDRNGRYAYANQPHVAQWNMARFAETLLPLFHSDTEKAIEIAEAHISRFSGIFQTAWLDVMRKKLGFYGEGQGDSALIGTLLQEMQRTQADYTQTFRALSDGTLPASLVTLTEWHQACKKRRHGHDATAVMCAHNPAVIPRNHLIEEVLEAAEQGDMQPIKRMLAVLNTPYIDPTPDDIRYTLPPKGGDAGYRTFCGT